MNVSELINGSPIKTGDTLEDKLFRNHVTNDSNNRMMHDIIKSDLESQYTVDPKTLEKYSKYGIHYDPVRAANGTLDILLADNQSGVEKAVNALEQAVVSEMILGTVKGFADLFDIIIGEAFRSDGDYQNSVSVALEQAQEAFKERNPIYTDPTKTGLSSVSDWGWWMSNLPSVASTVSLMIPGAAVGKGVSFVGKGIGAAAKAGARYTNKAINGINRARKIENAGKVGKVENWLNRTSVGVQSDRLLTSTANGLAMRTIENYQEARQVYNDMYENSVSVLNGMSDEEYAEFLERNGNVIENSGVDVNDKDAVAKVIAKESADVTFKMDYANLLFDVIQVYSLGNPLKLPKTMRKTAAVNKAQRESKIFAKYGEVEGKKRIAERTFGQKTKDFLGDRLSASTKVLSELSEGVEEGVNYIAQQEGMTFGNTMLDPSSVEMYDDRRIKSYLNNFELYESMFWGTLGGVMFQKLGSKGRQVANAISQTAKGDKNDKENTFKNNFRKNAEDKRRVAEIEGRLERLNKLRSNYEKIYNEGKDPFEKDEKGQPKTLTTNIDKDAAWSKAVDDYIVEQTFSAIESGNYDLFKDYLRDEAVKGKIEELLGKDDTNLSPKIDIENLIRRMDEVEKIYTDNMIMINGITGNIKESIPLEMLSSIARDNTKAQIKIQRLDDKIARYEESAEANAFRFANAIDPDMDYKTAVNVVTAANYLRELRKQKQELLNDKKQKGSIAGQLRLQNLNTAIDSVTQYLKELKPAIEANKVSQTNERLFQFANILFATQYSFDSSSNEYLDFLKNMANRDVKAINELTGTDFELTDDEIVEFFGEEGINSGSYYRFAQDIDNYFGVKQGEELSEFVKSAPNLADDYSTLASLNIAKIVEQKNIANTVDAVKTQVNNLKNVMDQARFLAINKARNLLVKHAKTYGRSEMLDYVFNNVPIAKMSEKDKAEVDDAVAVLDLTSPSNEKLVDWIMTNILLGDYEKSVEDAEQKKVKKPEPKPTPEPGENKEELKRIKLTLDVDSGVNISFVSKSDNTETDVFDYIEHEYPDGSKNYVVNFKGTKLTEEQKKRFIQNTDLFEGYDKTNTNPYKIISNPIINQTPNGSVYVAEKGKIQYEEKTDTTGTKKTEVPTSDVITPEGSEDIPAESTELADKLKGMSEEEARKLAEKDAQVAKEKELKASTHKRVYSIAKAMQSNGKTKEEIVAEVNKILNEIKQANTDIEHIDAILQQAANITRNKFDLIGVASALNEIKSSTVEEKVKGEYTEGFIKQVYNLIEEYAKAANIKKAKNGKYYINFEDFIRNINNIYNNKYDGKVVYDKLRGFLTSDYNDFVVIIDNINDPNLLDNANKDYETRLRERIGNRDNYRVQIDKFFENPTDEFLKAFDSLKIGDKLQLRMEGNVVQLLHKGVAIGELPAPGENENHTAFQQYNNGWLITLYHDKRNTTLRTYLSELAADNREVDNINDIINSLIYDNLSTDERNKLIDKAYNRFIDEHPELINKNTSKEEVVDFICKLWKYRMTPADFSKSEQERAIRIDTFLDRFFEKLYNTYDGIKDLSSHIGKDNVEIEVDNINDGEIVRCVEDLSDEELAQSSKNRNNYDKFTQSNKAFKNPKSITVGVVTDQGTLTLDKNESKNHDRLGNRGTVHVLIPNRNGKPNFVVGTSVLCSDTNIDKSSTAYKIIEASKDYIKRAVEQYAKNPLSPAAYNNLVTCIQDLFARNKKRAAIFKDVGVSMSSDGSITITAANLTINIINPKVRDSVDFYYTVGKNSEEVKEVSANDDHNILVELLGKVLDSSSFNIDFKFFTQHWSINNGAIGFTGNKNNKEEFGVIVDGKQFIFDSLSEFLIEGGLIRVNTKLEDGSNYRRKGQKQGANQILEVSLNTTPTSPVRESKQETTPITDNKTTTQTGEEILNNEDANTAVDKLVDLAMPNLRKNDRKELKSSNLLPKSIIFAENLTDNDGNKAIAQVNTKIGEVKVSRLWLDMYDGVGVYSSYPEAYRKQAIRKLIHEQVHTRIEEQGREETIKLIESIYNEFKNHVNSLTGDEKETYSKYLFEDKKDIAERLEEFLVESMTSQELAEKLNTIEASYDNVEVDKEKAKKESLFDKIIKLIAKIFDYSFVKEDKSGRRKVDIEKGKLLEKELLALRGALNTKGEVKQEPVNNQQEGDENFDFSGINIFGNKDGNTLNSTVVENIVPENVRKQREGIEKEMQQIKDKAVADGTFMKAPNGKPTNLNERQWLQVRTKDFINWFGDWENNPANASKVVDENGEPLVVYHYDKLDVKDFSKRKVSDFTYPGIYFSKEEKPEYGTFKTEAFLNIKNPFEAPAYVTADSLDGQSDLYDKVSSKYDGAIGYKFDEDTGEILKTFDNIHEFVVFNPNQIKSATDNVGTFSKDNNDIRYSTIVESVPTHSSVSALLASTSTQEQPQIARYFEVGEIETRCRYN